ncbi:MAG: U32 family peptidase [Prevotella sp.]|nr:U32 family peptidase [Prevotella sp.]
MQALELLAPAKNLETGIAAIDHGADAVYIGPPAFGARAAAGNSIADIAVLCNYARRFGAKVYATVNTLLHDDELPKAHKLILQLAEARVDAVLIQDMRLYTYAEANSRQPSLNQLIPFHASTQADNRTAEKVKQLYDQGFRRAVLARELSVKEIKAIHEAVPDMELEVFIHGALCVSYSGLCYASEHCYGRSANRGECAQVCRMKFDLVDANGTEIVHQRHLLSLRDLNQSAHLAELIEAGAMSFKIEGRLKDVAYVKNVTAAYSQLLNAYIARHPDDYCRASRGQCRYTFQPDLNRTFNRGYTTYFLHGRQPSMASFFTPKAIGQPVGTVKQIQGAWLTVAGTASFANGDGLCYFNDDKELQGFRVNRAEASRLYPLKMPKDLRPGTTLYRSNDQQMENLLSKPSAERKIPIAMKLQATPQGFSLTIDGQTVEMPMEHIMAQKSQRERIISELTKLGNTPYVCTACDIPQDFPYFIPASQIAALRRMAVESLEWRVENGEFATAPKTTAAENSKPYTINYKPDSPLMQCRYCLRYEMGYCIRHGGKKPQWTEPLSLRLADGHVFRLEFDCSKCQMNVLGGLRPK